MKKLKNMAVEYFAKLFIFSGYAIIIPYINKFIPNITSQYRWFFVAIFIMTALYLLFSTFQLIVEIVWSYSQKKQKNNYNKRANLLLFLAAFTFPAKDRDVETGNMIERHQLAVKRHGTKRAVRLLTWDVGHSFYKVIKYSIEKIIKKALKLLGLYQLYRIFFG